jgi:hypothetical protein
MHAFMREQIEKPKRMGRTRRPAPNSAPALELSRVRRAAPVAAEEAEEAEEPGRCPSPG